MGWEEALTGLGPGIGAGLSQIGQQIQKNQMMEIEQAKYQRELEKWKAEQDWLKQKEANAMAQETAVVPLTALSEYTRIPTNRISQMFTPDENGNVTLNKSQRSIVEKLMGGNVAADIQAARGAVSTDIAAQKNDTEIRRLEDAKAKLEKELGYHEKKDAAYNALVRRGQDIDLDIAKLKAGRAGQNTEQKDFLKQRDAFNKTISTYRASIKDAESAANMLSQRVSTLDQAVAYKVAKVLDPVGKLSDQDIDIAAGGNRSLANRAKQMWENIKSGKKTETTREEFMQFLTIMKKAAESSIESEADFISEQQSAIWGGDKNYYKNRLLPKPSTIQSQQPSYGSTQMKLPDGRIVPIKNNMIEDAKKKGAVIYTGGK